MFDSKYFWKKKVIVSYILASFVVIIHLSVHAKYGRDITEGGIQTFNRIYSTFFNSTFVTLSVPLFFIISGCLFFRNCKNIKDCYRKMQSRIMSLFVPFLLWNIIDMLFKIITSYSFCSKFFIGRQVFDLSIKNIVLSIFTSHSNGPFWFIFALIVFVILSPVIFLLLKNKIVSFIFLLILFVLTYFNIQHPLSNFFAFDAIIYYFIGCIIGRYYFNIFSTKITRKKSFLFLFIFCLCEITILFIVFKNIQLNLALLSIFNIVFAISFWFVCDLFIDKLKQYDFYNNSFMLYAMHTNIIAIIGVLIWLILPKNDYISLLSYILQFIFTLMIINYICYILKKYTPYLYNLLNGSRGG